LGGQVAALDATLKREREAYVQVEADLDERDAVVRGFQSQLEAAKQASVERDRVNRQLEESNREVARVSARLLEVEDLRSAEKETAESAGAELELQIEAAREEIRRLGSLAERATAVPILESQLERVRSALETSEGANRELEAQVSELEAARSTLSASATESDQLARKVSGLEAELASMGDSLAASEARNRDLERDAAALAETRESLAAAQAYSEELAQRLAVVEAVSPEPVAVAEVRRPLPVEVEEEAGVAEPLVPLPAEPSGVGESAPAIIEEDLPLPVPADLQAFARSWAKAWSDQRIVDYLSFYASSFVPPSGLNRTEWSELRRDRLTSPGFIEVTLSNYRTRIDGPDQAQVSFDQEYRSNTFQDRVTKTLELIREGDLWRIREEIVK
jgi:predicted RNase H-like nuclease (RuvC/YqgF family)